MAKSTTIWVSMKTKELADKLRGKKSYNQHYTELMEMYARGEIRPAAEPVIIQQETPVVIEKEKPVVAERAPHKGAVISDLEKQILMEEIREIVSSATVNPLVMEEVRQAVRKEIENQFWLNYPRYCRNCGYPTMSGASEPKPAKNSIFTMLV